MLQEKICLRKNRIDSNVMLRVGFVIVLIAHLFFVLIDVSINKSLIILYIISLIIKKFQTIYVSIVLENRIYFSFYSLRNIVINDGETKKLDLKKKKKRKRTNASHVSLITFLWILRFFVHVMNRTSE